MQRGSLSVYWSVKAGQERPAEEERMICPSLSVKFYMFFLNYKVVLDGRMHIIDNTPLTVIVIRQV